MTTDSVWMTQTARRRLEDELATLETNGDSGSAEAVARVQELRRLLRAAESDRKPDDGLVEPGMQVTVRFDGDGDADDGERETFLVGDRGMLGLDPDVDLDVYSPTSPMGAAITGRYVGDTVTYVAPNGEQKVTIVEAQPFG